MISREIGRQDKTAQHHDCKHRPGKDVTLMDAPRVIIATLGLSLIANLLPSVNAAEQDGLLERLLNQNEAARKKLSTISYKYEAQSEATVDLQGANLPPQVVRGPRTVHMKISAQELKKGKW